MYMHPDDLTSFSSPSKHAGLPVTFVLEAVPAIVVGIGTTTAAPKVGRKLTMSPSMMMKSDISSLNPTSCGKKSVCHSVRAQRQVGARIGNSGPIYLSP